MTVFDPLADAAIPLTDEKLAESGLDPAAVAQHRKERAHLDLTAKARQFVRADNAKAGPYGAMSPVERHRYAEMHGIPFWERLSEADLLLVLVYVDTVREQSNLKPLAPVPVPQDALYPPATVLPPPVKLNKLATSPTNQWRVAKTTEAALPGGFYKIHEGTIYTLAKDGREMIEALAAQGVQLEPHPHGVARHMCNTCETSWPATLGGPEACPMCYLREEAPGQDERIHHLERQLAEYGNRDTREQMQAQIAAAEERAAHAVTGEASATNALAEATTRLRALTAWAVEHGGAPPANADGFWESLGAPPSMVPLVRLPDPEEAAEPETPRRRRGRD